MKILYLNNPRYVQWVVNNIVDLGNKRTFLTNSRYFIVYIVNSIFRSKYIFLVGYDTWTNIRIVSSFISFYPTYCCSFQG